jgi:hypothetical protein
MAHEITELVNTLLDSHIDPVIVVVYSQKVAILLPTLDILLGHRLEYLRTYSVIIVPGIRRFARQSYPSSFGMKVYHAGLLAFPLV